MGTLTGLLMLLLAAIPLTGTWRFDNGQEFAGAKGSVAVEGKTVQLNYDFTQGGQYVAAYCDLDPPRDVGTVQFDVKKPAEAVLTVRIVDDSGQTFQKSITYDKQGWQSLSCNLGGWSARWGGAGDNVVHQPIKSVALLVESQGLNGRKGHILARNWATEKAGASAPTPSDPVESEYVVTDFDDLKDHRWNIDFSKTATSSLDCNISMFGRPRSFAVRVKGGQKGNVVRVVLGSHFQSYERIAGVLDGTEQTFEFSAPPEGWTHSGAEEGRVAYPLRLSALVLEKGEGLAAPAAVRMEEFRCRTVVPAANVVTLLPNLHEKTVDSRERVLVASCKGWNLRGESIKGRARITVRDWDGNPLQVHEQPWELEALGKCGETQWETNVPADLVFAEVEFALEAEGRQITSACAAFTAPLEGAGDVELKPQSPWGMGVFLYRYGNPESMDKVAALAQAAGVKWTREEFSWAQMEPQKGQFDFSYYDTVVDTARRHGISVYGLLSYWSSWTKPYTDEGIDDYCRWAAATVRHFKDRVRFWEVYNEPNIFFWSGPKELYPELMKKAYVAIKEADPGAVVLAISTSGIDQKFIRRCLDADAPFDVLTVHPYRSRLFERGFVNELQKTADLVGGRPVWITEMGWSTQVGGVDERSQAQLLARCYLGAVGAGVGNMGWYDFRDDGSDPFYNEANFGVLHEDLLPKPAYRALATICRTFTSGKPSLEERNGCYVFRMGGATAVWALGRNAELKCNQNKDLQILNLMGEDITPRGHGVTLRLRPHDPVFLIGGLRRLKLREIAEEEKVISF